MGYKAKTWMSYDWQIFFWTPIVMLEPNFLKKLCSLKLHQVGIERLKLGRFEIQVMSKSFFFSSRANLSLFPLCRQI